MRDKKILGHLVVVGAMTAMAAGGCGGDGTEFGMIQSASQVFFSDNTFLDSGFQCRIGSAVMHCCPPIQINGQDYRSAMIGANVDQNIFKCRPMIIGPNDQTFLDSGTQRLGMHACPQGSLMIGLRANANLLGCYTSSHGVLATWDEYVDAGTQDNNMHVCREDQRYAMVGIRIDRNQFICDTDDFH